LTALCVNLRFVIFSAQMRAHMMPLPTRWRLLAGYLTADVTYVLMMSRHGGDQPARSPTSGPLAYFWGLCAVNWSSWNVASLFGVLCANWIPVSWGLGFAGTLALTGLLVSLVKDRATLLSTVTAGAASVAAFSLPFKLNISLAVACAVVLGMWMDQVSKASLSAQRGARP